MGLSKTTIEQNLYSNYIIKDSERKESNKKILTTCCESISYSQNANMDTLEVFIPLWQLHGFDWTEQDLKDWIDFISSCGYKMSYKVSRRVALANRIQEYFTQITKKELETKEYNSFYKVTLKRADYKNIQHLKAGFFLLRFMWLPTNYYQQEVVKNCLKYKEEYSNIDPHILLSILIMKTQFEYMLSNYYNLYNRYHFCLQPQLYKDNVVLPWKLIFSKDVKKAFKNAASIQGVYNFYRGKQSKLIKAFVEDNKKYEELQNLLKKTKIKEIIEFYEKEKNILT